MAYKFRKYKIIIYYKMFHEQARFPDVVVRVKSKDREEHCLIDVQIQENGQVNLNQLLIRLRQMNHFQGHGLIFYFDHSQSLYVLLNSESASSTHFTNLICQNLISFKFQQKISDQLLANPQIGTEEDVRAKRSRERIIEEAFLLVEQWRFLYREGTLNEKGEVTKLNLEVAAQILNCPRKTLEDYYLLMRNGVAFEFDFAKCRREKIGVLRSFVKGKGKFVEQKKQFNEKKFFSRLRAQITGCVMQAEEDHLFDIMRSCSSSDEDIIFES